MELTKKQIILIAAVSGAILLLTLVAALIFTPGEGETSAEPSASPTQTVLPTPTPMPTATPVPTEYRLPLVPQWDTPRPELDLGGTAGAFVPQNAVPGTEPPGDAAGPWVENSGENARHILAVGLRNGRAAALLMLRLKEDTLTVAALPVDETPLEGNDLKARGAQAAALAEDVTGSPCEAWMALDLACLPAVLSVTGPLTDRDGDALAGDSKARAEGALSLTAGAVMCAGRVSLLKLPALKRAVGDGFASNLSPLELWSLFWTIRRGVSVQGFLLPTGNTDGGTQNYFGESS